MCFFIALKRFPWTAIILWLAAVVKLAYTYASGAYDRKVVRVQVPPAAPKTGHI